MNKKITLFFLISFAILFSNKVNASHIAGGDLSYTCLGGNQYQLNLNLFVDCLGFDPGASQTISFTSTCGGTATATVNVTNPGGTEISQLCPSQIGNSTCSGGTLPGMWLFNFTGVVTLAPPCDTWTMSWEVCCRNGAIVNLVTPASLGSYIEATINSATDSCNNSPYFTSQPIPYVCQGQLVNYNYGVVEADGDSLHFSLINAMGAGGTLLTYTAGYSATSPIPGITIDPLTGQLTFTPMTLGNFVVVVLVEEFDAAGNLIGTVMRDIQFIVQTCSNIVPDPAPTAGAITGMTGTAVLAGPYEIEMCEGANFNFTATYTDANPGDSLSIVTNLLSVLPGATITVTGVNPLTVSISWTAPGGSAGTNTNFSVTVNDGACPIMGQQTFVYDVNVNPRTLGGPDQIICGTQTATLAGTGGNVFTWSVLSGPPMVVGTNFSCNPCDNPVASPVSTTVYEVVSDLSGTCVNRDTVTVTVVADFSYVTAQSATTSCLLQPIEFDATATPGGTYTYSWSPATYLDNTSISNPTATITSPGTYTYYVEITSPLGCTKVDTATIVINASYPPNPVSYISDSVVCVGDTVQLGVTFGAGVPSVCGTNPVGCSASLMGQVGTGTATNTATTWPAPYANWYTSGKHQMLFRASELNAVGITGGKIDQLDFNVVAINGISVYHNYTINMGCTSLSALTTWVTGLSNVYTPKTHTVSVGWNAHNFDVAYEWDGISNLIVEICFNEGPPFPNYTQSCTSPYTTTPFVSCLYNLSDSSPMCPDLGFATAISNRPNVRFHYCGAAPDSTNYTYIWAPPAGVFNTTNQTTGAVPAANTQYYVIVTDSVSGCFDTAYVDVIANVTTLSVDAGTDVTICPGAPTNLNATGASQFVWTPAATLSNPLISNPVASPLVTTTYTVSGTSQCAAGAGVDSVTVIVPIVGPLSVDAGGSQEVCVGSPFGLISSSSGGFGSNTYSWTQLSGFAGDSIQNSNSPSASVTPSAPATNVYQVLVVDACGNITVDTVVVDVILDCDLNVPNVFTPNGDGNNDFFLISANGIKTFSISIYNRWGTRVFESEDITKSWDGGDSTDGTYFYIIKAESINGKQFDQKGYLQLLGKK
ncbi:MAG: gliding motility-associated C-terminal domain-containing protein [Bacteroidetes bacterium]|nr:gliding motility-associated C-terminal domain-containing protein [Bacteroidota bacterium]